MLIFAHHFVRKYPWRDNGQDEESYNNRYDYHVANLRKSNINHLNQLFNFRSKKLERSVLRLKNINFNVAMKKLLVITGVVLLVIVGLLGYWRFFYTKSFSPESDTNFESGGIKIHFNYSRPHKKNRLIFGPRQESPLVPYGVVWRTGANEATVFECNQDIKIKGNTLKAGTYSFWTIPDVQTWTLIFNTEYGQWGVDSYNQANRDPKNDVLSVQVPAVLQDKEFEQFTIAVEKMGEEMEIILLWDKTLVSVPFSK